MLKEGCGAQGQHIGAALSSYKGRPDPNSDTRHVQVFCIAKLEAARVTPRNPIEVFYGSMDAFADKVQVDVAAGKLDRDFPIEGIRRMHVDGCWGGWSRDGSNAVWEYANR